jgi:hypothetical protein
MGNDSALKFHDNDSAGSHVPENTKPNANNLVETILVWSKKNLEHLQIKKITTICPILRSIYVFLIATACKIAYDFWGNKESSRNRYLCSQGYVICPMLLLHRAHGSMGFRLVIVAVVELRWSSSSGASTTLAVTRIGSSLRPSSGDVVSLAAKAVAAGPWS